MVLCSRKEAFFSWLAELFHITVDQNPKKVQFRKASLFASKAKISIFENIFRRGLLSEEKNSKNVDFCLCEDDIMQQYCTMGQDPEKIDLNRFES